MTNGEKFKEVFGFGADGSRVIAVNATWWDCEFQNSKPITKRVPAADVRPVRRGKWTSVFDIGTVCNQCGYDIEEHGFDVRTDGEPNFCPNCGADMREES